MRPDLFIAALAVLFMLDAWTTLRILGDGGRELNPLMAKLMQLLSPAGALMLVKFGLLAWVGTHVGGLTLAAERLILGIYLGVVGWNLYQLSKGER